MLATSYRPILGNVGNIIRGKKVFWAFSPALTACCKRFSQACFQFRATVMRRKMSMRTSHKGIVGTRSQLSARDVPSSVREPRPPPPPV